MQLRNDKSLIEHSLTPYFDDIKQFSKRETWERSSLYSDLKNEITRVENCIEWDNTIASGKPHRQLRVAHWNVERGRNLEGILYHLQNDLLLSTSDVLLLTEVDLGMGRSGNANVARELALALRMNYAFANSFMNLCKGDLGEQAHDLENTLALHGTAILSRFPISSLRTQVLPVEKDFFEAQEKRLGRRRGLICGIEVDGHSVDLAAVHLELNSSPQHRARQLQAVVSHVESSGSRAKLIGGDFNTTTYNLHNAITCGGSLFYKVFIFGIESTIKHYMTPEKKFERPLFTMLRQHQFEVDSYNDRNKGTFYYDLKDRVTAAKTANFVPAISLRWLEHKLRPWNGRVPLRLDWFTGKGFQPQAPKVIERPMFENKLVSDHDPIVIDLVVP